MRSFGVAVTGNVAAAAAAVIDNVVAPIGLLHHPHCRTVIKHVNEKGDIKTISNK